MKIPLLITAALMAAATPAALAQGCCAAKAGSMSGCPMAAASHSSDDQHRCEAETQADATPSPARQVFAAPVQKVFEGYLQIQRALAQDSTEGIGTVAGQMAEAVRQDARKLLPSNVAREADQLAQSKDLASARKAYRQLSDSLIGYLRDQEVPPGLYHVAYCSMAKASWVQTGKRVVNPYMGKSMIHCGEIRS